MNILMIIWMKEVKKLLYKKRKWNKEYELLYNKNN